MPQPVDKIGVIRFLGIINYLKKFLAKLAEENEYDELKNIVTLTEILRYYDVKNNITI